MKRMFLLVCLLLLVPSAFALTYNVSLKDTASGNAITTYAEMSILGETSGQFFLNATNGTGYAYFSNVTADSYDYTIRATGYATLVGHQSAFTANTQSTVYLVSNASASYVTLLIRNNRGSGIEGARITVSTYVNAVSTQLFTIQTDATGTATFPIIFAQQYIVVIEADGYITKYYNTNWLSNSVALTMESLGGTSYDDTDTAGVNYYWNPNGLVISDIENVSFLWAATTQSSFAGTSYDLGYVPFSTMPSEGCSELNISVNYGASKLTSDPANYVMPIVTDGSCFQFACHVGRDKNTPGPDLDFFYPVPALSDTICLPDDGGLQNATLTLSFKTPFDSAYMLTLGNATPWADFAYSYVALIEHNQFDYYYPGFATCMTAECIWQRTNGLCYDFGADGICGTNSFYFGGVATQCDPQAGCDGVTRFDPQGYTNMTLDGDTSPDASTWKYADIFGYKPSSYEYAGWSQGFYANAEACIADQATCDPKLGFYFTLFSNMYIATEYHFNWSIYYPTQWYYGYSPEFENRYITLVATSNVTQEMEYISMTVYDNTNTEIVSGYYAGGTGGTITADYVNLSAYENQTIFAVFKFKKAGYNEVSFTRSFYVSRTGDAGSIFQLRDWLALNTTSNERIVLWFFSCVLIPLALFAVFLRIQLNVLAVTGLATWAGIAIFGFNPIVLGLAATVVVVSTIAGGAVI